MSTDSYDGSEPVDDDHGSFGAMRIILALVFGGILVMIFGAMAREHVRITPIRRRRGPVLTVEEAIRLRPQ